MYCFVMNCKMSCVRKRGLPPISDISFHRFPSDNELFTKWLKAIGVQNTSVVEWQHNMYLCSNHFKIDDFLEEQNDSSELPNICKLKSDAIPFLYPWVPEMNSKTSTARESSIATTEAEDKKNETNKDIVNCSITQTQTSTQQGKNLGTNILKQKVPVEFPPGSEFARKHLKHQEFPAFSGKFNRPRYMGDVLISDLENPQKAKLCLFLAKNLLVKQIKRIKQLKKENRVLYKKTERLRKIAQVAKRTPTKPSKMNETITLLVNI